MAQRKKSDDELAAVFRSGYALRRDIPDDELDSTTFSPVASFAPAKSSFGVSSAIPPGGHPPTIRDASSPIPPGARPQIQRRSDSDSPEEAPTPKRRKPARRAYQVRIPAWVRTPELRTGEKLQDCVSEQRVPNPLHLGLTAVPVFVIPVAVFLADRLTTVGSAAVFLLVAGLAWASYAFWLAPRSARRALIITTHRVLVVDDRGTLETDLTDED